MGTFEAMQQNSTRCMVAATLQPFVISSGTESSAALVAVRKSDAFTRVTKWRYA